ncbi:starch synthase 3, chloroplastic/amyloplastic [Dorcoceras hygrometricum]|uniref:Starch synthase 3, chloroplastic/amyloplastic n=1 Tax=Dorcoceras hygrometricum TaxID=472368 RepID=A0A2Z7B9R9_9LAMI|nr:starch synthase 3, chloroplastic/amyloplastic [Dorcoceras hygrometricum]
MLIDTKGIVEECSTTSQRRDQLGNQLRAYNAQEQERTQEQLRTRADNKCSLEKKRRSAQEQLREEHKQIRAVQEQNRLRKPAGTTPAERPDLDRPLR